MATSLRELFTREGLGREHISVRTRLGNHPHVRGLGLRRAAELLARPASGDGWSRGCQRPSQAVAGELAYVVPSWVPVDPEEVRTVEGVLTKSRVTRTDFPLRPWHRYYDWNYFVRPDRQYAYLNSRSNLLDHGGVIECEWDTSGTPEWSWPQDGDRVWIVGRWIYDCGHPGDNGHKTEIHPPRAVASFRSEAAVLPGNAGPTRCTQASVFLGRDGGYWQQRLGDRDYGFDLPLPPKPYDEARPAWRVQPMTGALPVAPQVVPVPGGDAGHLRVVLPLRSARVDPTRYGFRLWAGWSDPRGTESRGVQRVRVHLDRIFMDGDYDTFGDEWYVYVGINGRWRVWRSIGGSSESVEFTVDLDLHPTDRVKVTACGFEADLVHDHMGDDSGYTWAQVSDPAMSTSRREEIEDDVFWQLSTSLRDENDAIGHLRREHAATARGTVVSASDKRDYRLRYTLSSR